MRYILLVLLCQVCQSATLVQSAYHQGDPCVPTLGQSPAQGNLLVAVAAKRTATSHTNYTAPSGWTKHIGRDVLLGDSTYRRNTAVWSKVAGSSESSSVSIDDGTTAAKYCTLAEYSLSEGENEWTLLAAVSNDNGATSGGVTIGTSQTSSVAGARKFLVAVISVAMLLREELPLVV